MYGPLVLAGNMGIAGLTDSAIYGDSGPFSDEHLYRMPQLHSASLQGSEAVRRVPGNTLLFETVAQQETMQLKHLYQVT